MQAFFKLTCAKLGIDLTSAP